MQLENQNIAIKNVISSCRPDSSSRFRLYSVSSCSPAASTPPALLTARFTFVVVIEIFKIDYLKNSV